jgi:drug/metabolite transporter (DMT)-like permease
MLLSTLAFSSMDALVKQLGQSYPLVEVMWARSFFAMVLVVVIVRGRLFAMVMTRRPGLQLLRGALVLTGTAVFFTGLRFIPLADASALMATAPVIVIALAIPLLKEKVGARQWLGVAMGLAGAMIVIRPGADVMHWAIIFPMVTALTVALVQILARVLGHTDSVMTTMVYMAGFGTIVTSALVPFFWVMPTPRDWLFMVGVGFLGGLGQFAMLKAYQSARAVAVAPFAYSNLIWATMYGFLVFGDFPDGWTVLGTAIIVASGLYIQRTRRA